jgi:hypothetical protein
MGITRYFIGTAVDGKTYNFVEDCPGHAAACTYRLSSPDGGYLRKVSNIEFTIVRSGVNIRI